MHPGSEPPASSPPSSGFRAGDWVVLSERDRVVARRLGDEDELELTGKLSGVLEGDLAALSTLGQLGHIEPRARDLHDALRNGPRRELDYGAVLAKSGWSLLFLELTGQCNEACEHCYAESSPERKEHLSLEEVLSVVRQARELDVHTLQLTGGDPLVSRTYGEAARLAKDLGFPSIEVYTNGLALSDRVADELAECGVHFAFSFYSHRPEVHDAITRTPGSQARTLAAIRRALDRGLEVRIGVISMPSNRGDLAETVALLESVGVPKKRIGFDQERQVGRGEYLDQVVPYELVGPETRGEGAPAASESRQADRTVHGAARGQGGGKLCVSYSGTVYPCIFARNRPLGSIREQSLADILRTPLAPRASARALPMIEVADRLACVDCRRVEQLLASCRPVS